MKLNWMSVWTWIGISSLVALTTLLTNIGKILSGVNKVWDWFYRKLTRYHPRVPGETLRLIPIPQHCWWGTGSSSGNPAMQLVCDWYITNITDQEVKICGARIRKPNVNGFMVVRHCNGNIYGDYDILPHDTTEGRADFWIQPPIKKVGEPVTLDLEFIDQYGNVHLVKKVKFRAPQPPQKVVEPPMESITSIADPVEKEVVTVLQDEIYRYKGCGRRSGGLGSVVLNYNGRITTGVGSDGRKSDSPEQQSIIRDPQNAKIESDNGAILIGYYQTLGVVEKCRLIDIMVQRISRNTVYAPIGYFFLYVGVRIGAIKDILNRAKVMLKGDNAYGFSDLLRLLDGMLRYEYPSFKPETLDSIEQFIDGLGDEHTFSIPERIHAIRAYHLSQKITLPQEQKKTA